MFGEQYPNPVRVVSVGADLAEVLLDKSNSKWEKYSIEFCGGTHLGNTSEGASFSIVSEEPVSMGVRRIVAVTGDAAQLALTEGERLQKAIIALAALPDDDKLSGALFLVQSALDKATIPSWKRLDLRALLAAVQERVRIIGKRREEETKNRGVSFLNSVIEQLKANISQRWVVESLDVGNNNRVLADTGVDIINQAKSELGRDVAVILFSNDPKTKKIYVSASVPESLIAKGLKANEWTAEVCAALGGKGGGSPKGDVAQGNGPNVDALPVAVEKAKAFAQGKL
jgi:alanyl-tRNA synthetase